MIVTCDHCGARYKLEESRVSGRGAKITCPRCQHVFVVYREQETEIEPQALAVGGDRVASASGGGTASQSLDAVEPMEAAGADAPLDVHALKFRTVGIQAWKVKVKIGLVYDFSDYKTLAKYISDGRVTEGDLLSHDGETWTPIGEIPDLKQHFIDVYVACEAAMRADVEAASTGGAEDYEDDSPTNIIGMEGLADSIGSDQAESASPDTAARQLKPSGGLSGAMEDALRTGGGDQSAAPRFVDPFEARKQARSAGTANRASGASGAPKAPPVVADEGSKGGLGLVLVAVLAVGGGAFWWMQQEEPAPVASAPAQVATVAPATEAPANKAGASGDQELQDLEQALLEEAAPVPPEEAAADELRDKPDWEVDEEPKLCPRGADGKFRCPDGSVMGSPTESPDAAGTDVAPALDPVASAGGVPEKTARDHASEGDRALAKSDYRSAVAAFRAARKMEPRNAAYSGKLGVALFRSGDIGSAQNYLSDAAQRGYARAHEYLGDIASQQGDSAGAISHYQTYIQAGAPDAARVQQKIDQLSGR